MKIWIYLNGIQQGPYTLDELATMAIAASTPVWYEGLPQWMPACEAEATADLFGQEPQGGIYVAEPVVEQQPSDGQSQARAADVAPCPPTFIGWSIFCLICCCQVGGILGIIFSSLVKSNYRSGDYKTAEKMSNYAEWTVILSIVLGLVFAPLTWILYL